MTRVLLLVGISIAVASCLPDPLPVNTIPEIEPKIVVSSQVITDQSVVVLLTRTFSALDADGNSDPQELLNQIAINDAFVVLEGMGMRDTLDRIDIGVYRSASISFVDEGTYTLYVDSPTMGTVTATTTAKTAVNFLTVKASIYDTGYDTLATIDYSFLDVPGKNYYMVTVQHVSTEDPLVPEDFLNPNVFVYLKQDEEGMDGARIEDSFNALFRRDFIPGDTVLVQLVNIEKGYNDFLQARKDARFNFSDFLGEPVNYPSNVLNGLGWFSLHYPDFRVLQLEE